MRSPACLALIALAGCPSPPPEPKADGTTAPRPSALTTATEGPTKAAAQPGAAQPSAAEMAPTPTASASAQPPTPPEPPKPPQAPKLTDDDGELLPQTKDEPTIEDPLFEHRLDLLWQAIVADDPEIARDFFFPKVAYLKVKAIKDPGRDWERRLWKLFVRDVHEYHDKLGDDPKAATFLRLDFPADQVKWMKKHKEGNAIGYYRIKRPYLVFKASDGSERKLEITAMISWRGQWHVVHLHGFK